MKIYCSLLMLIGLCSMASAVEQSARGSGSTLDLVAQTRFMRQLSTATAEQRSWRAKQPLAQEWRQKLAASQDNPKK